jgi:hypothetical protein
LLLAAAVLFAVPPGGAGALSAIKTEEAVPAGADMPSPLTDVFAGILPAENLRLFEDPIVNNYSVKGLHQMEVYPLSGYSKTGGGHGFSIASGT